MHLSVKVWKTVRVHVMIRVMVKVCVCVRVSVSVSIRLGCIPYTHIPVPVSFI